ncbi:hypothetical protein [Haloarchaeobius amylolyticus]|uniref:hypothetical protein n=1 Tax=Haloarchaeobius amylolyticus TaxID=1198296 RepID=UPI002270CEC1|nr:hypothetical protein [Haloarchaeobius amylolyticus]
MTDEVPPEVERLAAKMASEYVQSEYDIARALAAADGPLTLEELVDETGYTDRTVEKRLGTLEERLGGEPLITRTEDGDPRLHPILAKAIKNGASE